MNIIIEDIILIIIVIEAVLFVPFILSCIFKKTCKWKKCPFRSKHYGTMDVWDCTKCPYPFDAEEEAELERICDQLEDLIEQIACEKRHN